MTSTTLCAAAAGSSTLSTAVRRPASGSSRLTATTPLAFALPRSTSREAQASSFGRGAGPAEPDKPRRVRRDVNDWRFEIRGLTVVKIKIFSLPAMGDEVVEDAFNLFIAQHRVVQVDRHLIQNGADSYWSICVGYQNNKPPARSKSSRINYREILSFYAAAAGSTTPVTAARLTVTGKSRLTATTTLAFALPSSICRWMPAGRPAHCPVHYLWQTVVTRHALVATLAKTRGGY